MKAYEITDRDYPDAVSAVAAATAGRAKYMVYRQKMDVRPAASFADFRCLRAPHLDTDDDQERHLGYKCPGFAYGVYAEEGQR